MRVIATARDLARVGAFFVLGAWFAFYRPAGILGGDASYILVTGQSMLPTFRGGDLVVALPSDTYRSGDVVVFTVPAGEPGAGGHVIHRIVRSDGAAFVTRGDNNAWDDRWRPTAADVLGTPVLHVPGAGAALAILRSPLIAGLGAAVVALVVLEPLIGGAGRRRRRSPEAAEVAAGS